MRIVGGRFRLRLPDSDAARVRRDDDPAREISGMVCQDLAASAALLRRAKIDKAKDAVVWKAPKAPEFAEVLIQGDEHALFPARAVEQGFVARVFSPVPCPDDVVPRNFQLRFGPWADAGIQKDFQEVTSRESGSMRSLAAMRRA